MSYSRKQSDVKAARSEKDRAAVRVSAVVRVLDFYPDSMTVDVQPLVKEKIDGQYASGPHHGPAGRYPLRGGVHHSAVVHSGGYWDGGDGGL